MPQDSQRVNIGVKPETKHHQDKSERDSKDQESLGAQKTDVKEDLELRKGADEMPELKDDLLLQDDEQITLDLEYVPPEVMEYARRVLGETDEVKCQTLQELRDMIYGKSNCPISLRLLNGEDVVGVIKLMVSNVLSREYRVIVT